MNHTDIPTPEHARRIVDKVLAEAAHTGRRPSVLAAAHGLGLSNTTFRRHFPHLVLELGQARRTPLSAEPAPAQAEQTRLAARNAQLRRDNRQLRDQLELAAATIRGLSLTVHRLDAELKASNKITSLNDRRRTHSGSVTFMDDIGS